MPLYEYVCRDCRLRFETLVRSFREPVSCPACRGRDVEKQLSSFALATAGAAGTPAGAGGGACCGRGGCGCHG